MRIPRKLGLEIGTVTPHQRIDTETSPELQQNLTSELEKSVPTPQCTMGQALEELGI